MNFDLHSLFLDLHREFYWQAEEKNLNLTIQVLEGVPLAIKGDRTRLLQILINLISNAIKFTPSGFVRVTVGVLSEVDDSVNLKFEVADSGVGIAAATLPKLFQSFCQGDSSMTRKYGGSGLGLSICKKLAALMNSDIQVSSKEGEGSHFSFSVLFEKGQLQLPPLNNSLVKKKWATIPRILLVEDLFINQRVVTLLLENLDCQVEVAQNGKEALEILKVKDFDLILMDCRMPELDGYSTARLIRQSEDSRYCHLPIIAMTANAISGDRERCLEAGMDDYLLKPVRMLDLHNIILQWLRNNDEMFSTNSVSLTPVESSQNIFLELKKLDAQENTSSLKELIMIFFKNNGIRMSNLETAIEQKKIQTVIKETHDIKSSSTYLGAYVLGQICDRIELSASKNDFEDAKSYFIELDQEYKILCQNLSKEL